MYIYICNMFFDCSNLKPDPQTSGNLQAIVESEPDLHRVFVARLRMQANITKKTNKVSRY